MPTAWCAHASSSFSSQSSKQTCTIGRKSLAIIICYYIYGIRIHLPLFTGNMHPLWFESIVHSAPFLLVRTPARPSQVDSPRSLLACSPALRAACEAAFAMACGPCASANWAAALPWQSISPSPVPRRWPRPPTGPGLVSQRLPQPSPPVLHDQRALYS